MSEESGKTLQQVASDIFFYFSEMDIPSQKFGLFWGRFLITIGTIVSVILGYSTQNFMHTVAGISAVTLLAIAVFSPAWPAFKKRGLKFLDAKTQEKKTK